MGISSHFFPIWQKWEEIPISSTPFRSPLTTFPKLHPPVSKRNRNSMGPILRPELGIGVLQMVGHRFSRS